MTEPKCPPQLRVALLGLDPVTRKVLDVVLPKANQTELPTRADELLELKFDVPPHAILVGPPPAGTDLFEIAQLLRMRFQHERIYFLTSLRQNFDRSLLQKNGFTDAFLIPVDTDLICHEIRDLIAKVSNGAIKQYREVKLIDLRPGQSLDFDTYIFMPVNRKHIRISASGDEIDEARFNSIRKNNVSSIHVSSDQMKNFYAFAARQLKTLQNGKNMSETERTERMSQAVRTLIAGVFSDTGSDATIDSGRGIVSDCQEIVKNFIIGDDPKNNWYEKIMALTGAESGSYNHAGNVATFAALFSLAIGSGKPEDVALAGLLHDIGLADVPGEIQAKEEEERDQEERDQYRKHVDHSLNLIKFRKLILSDTVTKAIHQHHERWSGTGYPRGLAGSRICIEAQILALADVFDYMTITREGMPRMAPAMAFRKIYEENLNNSATAQFDLELLKRFMAVFPDEEEVILAA